MPELDKLVTIKLDKERHLRLTLKGMLEFQKLTGKNLLKGFNFQKMTLEEVAGLLWACLIFEDKDLTFDNVLCMLDIGNLPIAMDALAQCINQSLPEVGKSPLAETSRLG